MAGQQKSKSSLIVVASNMILETLLEIISSTDIERETTFGKKVNSGHWHISWEARNLHFWARQELINLPFYLSNNDVQLIGH